MRMIQRNQSIELQPEGDPADSLRDAFGGRPPAFLQASFPWANFFDGLTYESSTFRRFIDSDLMAASGAVFCDAKSLPIGRPASFFRAPAPTSVPGLFLCLSTSYGLVMAQLSPRVIRAYSLPVPLFDHLKVFQRSLQLAADIEAGTPDQQGDPHWIDNSRALAHVLQQHTLFSVAAGQAGDGSNGSRGECLSVPRRCDAP
jgi:hypothetical protein